MIQLSRHPLEDYFNITFKNKDLLKTALTHSSYANENGGSNNERLEFVGDAVVDLLVGEYLFRTMKEQEGTLTKKRANIVCEKSLSHYASLFHLEDYLLLGKGEENIRNSVSSGIQIHKGDYISILDSAIVNSMPTRLEAVKDLIMSMLTNESTMITIFMEPLNLTLV